MLKDPHYDETVDRLAADPIILAMATEVPDGFTEPDGFVVAALRRYEQLGGVIDTHIGGPREALMRLRPDVTWRR